MTYSGRRHALSRLSLTAAAVSLSGCGIYLHDAGLETSTSGLKTSYESLQAPAMLAELKAGEMQFASDEDRAVVEYGVAARNALMTAFIRDPTARAGENAAGDRAARTRDWTGLPGFRRHVRAELNRIYYGSPATNPAAVAPANLEAASAANSSNAPATTPVAPGVPPASLEQLIDAPDVTATMTRHRARLRASLQDITRQFVDDRNQFHRNLEWESPDDADRRRDRRPTDCAQVLPPGPAPTRPAQTGTQESVNYFYHAVQRDCAALRQLDIFGGSLGMGGLLNGAASGTELAAVRAELAQSHARRQQAETQVVALTNAIEAIEKGADNRRSLETLNQEIENLRKALVEAGPRARLIGLERLSTFIEELLAAELTTEDETAIPTATTTKAAAALSALRAIARSADAFARQPRIDRTNELLLGTARIRHDLRMTQLDVALERAETQILEAQAAALMAAASNFARAQLIINRGALAGDGDFTEARRNADRRGAAGEALAAYVGAWNQGEIPYRVLQLKAVQVRRAVALERATMTEADYRTALRPVFDQLAAYGAGGIRPETIAELLGQLGIAGAILGE